MRDLPANTLSIRAWAKVNLFLRVLGTRTDGYHGLDTVIVPVTLHDRLEIHALSDPRFRTLSLSVDVTGEPEIARAVPTGESNLVLRAATALAGAAGVRGFADFLLEKRIPPAAGLGGGSADAAATLRGLNGLWGCGLDDVALRGIGADVGSDVPALLAGGTVRASGRGEVIRQANAGAIEWVLVTFPFGVSTASAFRWWDEDGGVSGPDPAPLVDACGLFLRDGPGPALRALGPLLYNDLEEPVMRRHPEVREARDRLLAGGAVGAVMSGSGPSVAGIVLPDSDLDPAVEQDIGRLSGRAPLRVRSRAME
ncbi:4-(cytidine 5'-diphospho)-2-C-methyl-D-erythritol kinase [soil metagenome]